MRLQLAIWKIQANLALLLAKELVLLNPAALLLASCFPVYYLFLWFIAGVNLEPILLYVLAVAIAIIGRKLQLGSDLLPRDQPLSKPLASYPRLHEKVKAAALQLGTPVPRSLLLALSPVPFSPYGVDLHSPNWRAGEIPIPIGCLQLWSASDLQAHVARMLVFRRGSSWLLRSVQSAIDRLVAEDNLVYLRPPANWILRAKKRFLNNYVQGLNQWRLFADVEADLQAVRAVGAESVMSLVYKTELASLLVPACLASVIEPALDQHALLPIAESCAAFISAGDPHWQDAISEALRGVERNPEGDHSALAIRLAGLSLLAAGSAVVQDPRPASSLVDDMGTIERDAAVNEFGSEKMESVREISHAEALPLVVMPQIESEVERNAPLLQGKTRFDIPELLQNKSALAALYCPEPKYLFAEVQKEGRIPYLLGAFLTVELSKLGWQVTFRIEDGIHLQLGDRKFQPFTLIEQLDAKSISVVDFLDTVR